jgi:hypothetical protein
MPYIPQLPKATGPGQASVLGRSGCGPATVARSSHQGRVPVLVGSAPRRHGPISFTVFSKFYFYFLFLVDQIKFW